MINNTTINQIDTVYHKVNVFDTIYNKINVFDTAYNNTEAIKVMLVERSTWLTEPSLYISAVALIVSIFMFFTARKYYKDNIALTKKHYRQTTRPEVRCYRNLTGDKESIVIKNCGKGTALINSIEFIYKRERFENLSVLIKKHKDNDHLDPNFTYNTFIGGYILQPEFEFPMFNATHKNQGEIKDGHLDSIVITIEYCSYYDRNENYDFTQTLGHTYQDPSPGKLAK
ncbi:MAG: hypothetical protein JEZ03_07085 [Bacteroidales bacterium]|nr:hypothetical protein [Bacteroidales bacterium]